MYGVELIMRYLGLLLGLVGQLNFFVLCVHDFLCGAVVESVEEVV